MKVKSRKLQKLPILTFQQSVSYLAGRLLTGYSRLAWIPLHFHTKQQEKIWSNKITETPTTLSRVCQDFFISFFLRFLTWVNPSSDGIGFSIFFKNVATAKFTYWFGGSWWHWWLGSDLQLRLTWISLETGGVRFVFDACICNYLWWLPHIKVRILIIKERCRKGEKVSVFFAKKNHCLASFPSDPHLPSDQMCHLTCELGTQVLPDQPVISHCVAHLRVELNISTSTLHYLCNTTVTPSP